MGRLIWLIAAAALLCGCRTQKVASESLTADTVMVRDTLYGRDSGAVLVRLEGQGQARFQGLCASGNVRARDGKDGQACVGGGA